MRKLIFSALCLGFVVLVNAQSTSFKPFKVDFATGYAMPSGSGAKAGFLFAIEPKYAVNDNIAVGLRFEGAIMARAAVSGNGDFVSADVKVSGSYVATADYYFNTNRFRPFAGIGAGLYTTAGAHADSNGDVVEGAVSRKFGGLPRVGFEFGHFRAAVEYNLVPKTGSIPNSYIGIKLGFFAGGGRL